MKDNKSIRKALRSAGVPAYSDYLKVSELKYEHGFHALYEMAKNHDPSNSQFYGAYIYPRISGMYGEVNRIIHLLAKQAVLNRHSVFCFSMYELLMETKRSEAEAIEGIYGKDLYITDFYDDSYKESVFMEESIIARVVIKHALENGNRVFLGAMFDSTKAKEYWGSGFMVNTSFKLQEYRLSPNGD